MLQLTNPAYSVVYSEVIRDPQPLRSLSDYNDDDQDTNKTTESKIPKLKQVVKIYQDRKKAANELKESQVPSSQQRRSSIPRLKKATKVNKNVEVIDKNETPAPEDEFDKIYDEMVLSDNEVVDTKSLDKIEVGDADKLEHKFEEIIHDYKENLAQPIDVKQVRSRIPLVKQKSFPELQLAKKYSRRSSLKDISIDKEITSDVDADSKLESKLHELDVSNPVATKQCYNKEIDIHLNEPTYKTENMVKQYDEENLSKNDKEPVPHTSLNPDIKPLPRESVKIKKPDFTSINSPVPVTRTKLSENSTDTKKDENVSTTDKIIESQFDIHEPINKFENKPNVRKLLDRIDANDDSRHVNRSISTDSSLTLAKQVDLEFVPKENIIPGESKTDLYEKVSVSDNNTDTEILNDDDNERNVKYGLAKKIRRDSVEKLRYSRSDSVPMYADKTTHDTPPNTPNVQNELQDLISASDSNVFINSNSEDNIKNYNRANAPANEETDEYNTDYVTNEDLIFGDVENSNEQTNIQDAINTSEATNLLLDNVVIEFSPIDRTTNDDANIFTPSILAVNDVNLKYDAENNLNTTPEFHTPFDALDRNIGLKDDKDKKPSIIEGKVNRMISKLHSVDETMPKKEIELPVKKSVMSKIAMFETRTKESEHFNNKKSKPRRGMELLTGNMSKPKIVDQVYKNEPKPKQMKEEILNNIERDIKLSDYYLKSLEAYESEPIETLANPTETLQNTETATRQEIKYELLERLTDKKFESDQTREKNYQVYKNEPKPKQIKDEILNNIERDIKPSDYYLKSLEAYESEPIEILGNPTETLQNTETATRQEIKYELFETLTDKKFECDQTRDKNVDQRHDIKETLRPKKIITDFNFERKHINNDNFSIESRLRRLESNDGREIVSKSKSMAELHLLKGKVSHIHEMIDRINAVDIEEKKRKLNKEKPRRKSVSDKVALFERKLITVEMSAEPKPAVTQTTDSDNVRTMTEEEYEKRIADLRVAKEKYGVFKNMKYITLRNGVEMPVVALGTALMDPVLLPHIIGAAIDIGFRAIDTAYIYGNEKQIGEAIQAKIQDGTVKREDLFIIGKLWSTFHRRDLVAAACKASLENLGLDYFDLYLVHNPMSFKEGGDPIPKIANVLQYSEVDYLEAWYGMENLVSKGLARSIGVSNFNSEQVAKVVDKGRIKPVVNQVECHPYLNQLRLDQFCADRDIKLMCFGTLGSKGTPDKFKSSKASVIDDPLVKVMAAGLNITPAQLLIRYQIECGHAVVSKISKPEHMWEVLQAMTFHLTLAEVEALNALNRNKRTYSFEGMGDTHKNYPFKIPF